MTAIKARDVDSFLAHPDIKAGFILIYGPDAGRVRETTDKLQTQFHGQTGDPMGLVSLQFGDFENPGERISVEANTPSMFGDQRIIRVRGATNALTKEIEQTVKDGFDAILLVESGNLTPKDGLRKLAEAQKSARAVPCYADDTRSLTQLARQMFEKAQITVENDALRALIDVLGNDRQITRQEVEKLILFAQDTKHIDFDDVMVLCGDNAAQTMDEILDSTGTGHMQKLDTALTRAFSSGTNSSAILTRALMHFSTLREMRAGFDEGKTLTEVLNAGRFRVHFSRKSAIESQIRSWSSTNLAAACVRLHTTVLETRKNANLADEHTRQALLAIATIAARN
ncbi:DNA polymerase III subunit delta [Maritalea sp.]|uniref:DNA polymerase III subunit delta n=1 Tax=Maritalea sp. TaxID=2003361 RepID=UPI0039E45439